MAAPTREEIDAKLAAAEARSETRFVELSGKIDRLADTVGSLRTAVTQELGYLRTEMASVKTDNKFTRISIIVAVVASVFAALGALWVTQSNMLSAFSTGLGVHPETPPASTNGPTPGGKAG
jgi:hypothetical protein